MDRLSGLILGRPMRRHHYTVLALLLLALLLSLSLPNAQRGIVPQANAQTSCGTTNIALNKPASSSAVQGANVAGLAVDGNGGTRWESVHGVDPGWIRVDLGATQSICRVQINWEGAYASAYHVQISNDGTNFTTIRSLTGQNGGIDDNTGLSGSGRYVRIYGTTRALPYGYSIWELQIYTGSGTVPTNTLVGATATRTNTTAPAGCSATSSATGKPATASSVLGGNSAAMAVDNNTGTRWESVHGVDPQWMYVDLGATQSICRVRINWEPAYARAYHVQVSGSASGPWTTIYSTSASDGGIDDLTGLSGSGRYVRIYGTTRALPYGYSIWELQIYTGTGGGPTATMVGPTATRTRTATRTNTSGVATSTPPPGTNVQLSFNKPATASSQQDNANCVGCTPDKAFDNNSSTRWASDWADPQWIQVDLGATATISRVRLEWEAAFARSYQIQVSGAAGGPWITIYSTTTGDGNIDDLTGLSGSGRYVRMNGTVRGTAWGYSLYEFQVFGTGGAPNPTPVPTRTATPHSGNYTLIWSDEFDGPANAFPDASKWQIEVNANPPNNEQQNYTARTQNVRLNGAGQLILEAHKEALGGKPYTSGRINTNGRFTTTYGKIEARIRLPGGTGLWPAFWTLGNDIGTVGWPACGELDIMEFRGRLPRQSSSAIHGPNYSGATPFFHNYDLPAGAPSFVDDYHIFSLEWEPTQLRFYVDGNLHYTVNKSQIEVYGRWVFDHPHFIILNLAVGGVFDGNQLPPDSALPARVLIDYVRVYQ